MDASSTKQFSPFSLPPKKKRWALAQDKITYFEEVGIFNDARNSECVAQRTDSNDEFVVAEGVLVFSFQRTFALDSAAFEVDVGGHRQMKVIRLTKQSIAHWFDYRSNEATES
jgi:hypothetical protein